MKFIFIFILLLILSAFVTAAKTAVEDMNTSVLKDDDDTEKLQKLDNDREKYALPFHLCAIALDLGMYSIVFSNVFPLICKIWEQNLFLNIWAKIILFILTSFIILLFCEVVPKRVVLLKGERFIGYIYGIVGFMGVIFTPFTLLLRALGNGVARLFGVAPDEDEESVSEEDIVMMLDAGAEDGTINKENIEYIKNVFELDHLTAAEVMTPRNSIELIDSEATDEEILKLIEESGYSRIPVYTDTVDNITGILYARDYLLRRGEDGFKTADAVFQPTFVPETVHLDALFKDMQMDHNHIVIVVDEYGGTAGLVTMEDILEEIVGEIWDEQDEEIENFQKQSDGTIKILSATPVDEFFEFFSLEKDEEIESSTLNGWVTEKCGKIPEEGFSFEYENLTVTVIKADDLHTEEISVKINEPEVCD